MSLLSTVASLYPRGGGDPEPGPAGWNLPAGVPAPACWYSAKHVTVDGGGIVQTITNLGAVGAAGNISRSTGSVTIETPPSWASREVFSLPNNNTSYNTPADITSCQWMITMSTYKDGLDGTFDEFAGIVSGGMQLLGHDGQDYFYQPDITDLYLDNAYQPDPTIAVLPMLKKTIGVSSDGSFRRLWSDDFSASRHWGGLMGDILVWKAAASLTQTQIEDSMAAMEAYFTS